jgi:hypothetical protein
MRAEPFDQLRTALVEVHAAPFDKLRVRSDQVVAPCPQPLRQRRHSPRLRSSRHAHK